MKKNPILLVDDDDSITTSLGAFLESRGYPVVAVNDGCEALVKITRGAFSVVVSDIYIDRVTGLDVLEAARGVNPRCAVVLMTARGSLHTTVEAEAGGVFEYLAKPVGLQQLLNVIERASQSAEVAKPAADAGGDPDEPLRSDDDMVGTSAAMVALYKSIASAARSDATTLILGETGAGKERVAQAIHRHSRRADGPLAPVDCAAIAENLWESELFGAVRGAFTGADRDRPGVLRQAEGGTVFLDEIGEIPLSFQSKLLRLLETLEFRPVGAASPIPVDVRVVAATNRNLTEMVAAGTFREDLFHRLNVLRIVVPPLRERREDIPALARRFLQQANARQRKSVRINVAGIAELEAWIWPGNVRELVHAVERVVAETWSAEAGAEEVRAAIGRTASAGAADAPLRLEDFERHHVMEAIRMCGGNMTAAAVRLGIQRRTLYKKLERYGNGVPGTLPVPETQEGEA
jgi:DNA-binding NtrC family response regulator